MTGLQNSVKKEAKLTDSVNLVRFHSLFQLQSTFLSNPLNLLLLLILLYIAIPIFLPQSPNSSTLTPTLSQARSESNPSRYSALPKNHPESIVWKKYSPRTLAVHDGSALNPDSTKGKAKGNGIEGDEEPGSKILLAILGKVFDVTKGANFYGPGKHLIHSNILEVWLCLEERFEAGLVEGDKVW